VDQRLEALKMAVLDYAEGRIKDLNGGDSSPIPCIRASRSPTGDILVAISRWGRDGAPLVVAWKADDRWQTAGVASNELMDWVSVAQGGLGPAGPELVMINGTYTGGNKQLVYVRVNQAGELDLLFGPQFHRSTLVPVQENLFLATYRSNMSFSIFPMACAACVPLEQQSLVQWDGKRFLTLAARPKPDPVLTLNLLRVALQRADREMALAYVTSPDLLSQLRPLLLPSSDDYVGYAKASPFMDLEERNWDALPAALRTPLPPDKLAFDIALDGPGGAATIHLVRGDATWLVSGLVPSGTPRASASLDEVSAALRRLEAAKEPQARYKLVGEAAALLELFLTSPDSQNVDPALLPGVTIYFTPQDGVRLISLTTAPVGFTAWSWIQWWEGGQPRLQAVHAGDLGQTKDAGIIDGPDGVRLAILEHSARDLLQIYRLDAGTGRWVSLSTAFAPIPTKLGAATLANREELHGEYDRDMKTASIVLLDGGRALQVCTSDGATCLTARWNGSQYIPD
jgi:hypothetical protein